jgi:hypothetical protein
MLLSKIFSKPSLSPTRLLIAASLTTASIAGTATTASAAACQADNGGCVLPIAAPAPVVADVPPPIVDEGGGIGLLPILIGLAALAALLWLLLDDDEEEGTPSPG